jgi:WD40 repeat protein
MNDPTEIPLPSIEPTARLHKGHTFNIRALGWSPDGAYLAVGGDGKTIRVWRAAPGRSVCTYRGHSRIWALAWSPDGREIASGGLWGTVQIWQPW